MALRWTVAALLAVLASSACADSDDTSEPDVVREVNVPTGYSAEKMPDLLESSLRLALQPSVPELGPASFFAGDDSFQSLPPERYDDAKFMYVDFGQEGQHEWRLYVGRLGSDTEGPPPGTCKDAPEGGIMSCSESRTEDGEVIRTQISVGLLVPKIREYQLVDYRTLDRSQWRGVRLERTVSIVHGDGYEASAYERVFGPSVMGPEAFKASAEELQAAANDDSIYFGEASSQYSGRSLIGRSGCLRCADRGRNDAPAGDQGDRGLPRQAVEAVDEEVV